MSAIELNHIRVDFPLFFAAERSVKWNLLDTVGSRAGAAARTTIRALDSISLTIAPGARLALLGGNAAGKTTLLRVLDGALAPTRGRIAIQGRSVSLLGTGIGIDPAFTTRQTLMGHGLLLGFTAADCRKRLDEAVAFGDLGDILDMQMTMLGQGQQIRVALSVAAAYAADILLIDEMLEHLSPPFIDRLCRFIATGMPKDAIVVIAERSRSLVERICTQAIVLDGGRLADQGDLQDMLKLHGHQLST